VKNKPIQRTVRTAFLTIFGIVVTLTFDLLISKSNQVISVSNNI